MVTITVLKPFYDLVERHDRKVGEEFKATDARAKDIAAKIPGYIKFAPAKEAAPVDQVADVPEKAEEGFDGMTVAQLKAYAREVGVSIPSGAKKAEIIAILKG